MKTFTFLIAVSVMLVAAVHVLNQRDQNTPPGQAGLAQATPALRTDPPSFTSPGDGGMAGQERPIPGAAAASRKPAAPAAPFTQTTIPAPNVNPPVSEETPAETVEPEVLQAPPSLPDPFRKSHRVELSGTLNRRSPYEIYGGPKILTLGYFQTQSPTFSFFGEASAHDWKEGQAVFFSGGAFKDWTQRLYTFTAAGLGSDSTFLPHYRVDQDFNFKVGEKKNVVLTAGGSFIRYHDVHKDTLLAGGLAWYLGSWVANYRLTRIQSDPGGVLSTNHLFSVNQGYVGRRSDALTVSFGSQGYIATVVSPEEGVYSDTFFVEGRHRQWLKEDLGAFLYLHYNSVSDVFVERGATLGVFFEY